MSDASHKSVPEWAKRPAWAVAEACRRVGVSEHDYRIGAFVEHLTAAIDHLVVLIAEHEEAPVDPLLIEAREIAAQRSSFDGGKYLEGRYDDCFAVECTLAALQRGIEIGGAK